MMPSMSPRAHIDGIAGERDHNGIDDRRGGGMRLDLGSRAAELRDSKTGDDKPGEPNVAAHLGCGEAGG